MGMLEPALITLLNAGVDGHLLVRAPLVKLRVVDVQILQVLARLPDPMIIVQNRNIGGLANFQQDWDPPINPYVTRFKRWVDLDYN